MQYCRDGVHTVSANNTVSDDSRTTSLDGVSPEKLLYFYHSDHLGSTSLITNFDGEVTQHVEYIPYGEVFLEERNGVYNTPYLFNAKEFDEETGLYYYGARYLNPTNATWLSVDPLFEKYVGMSPYNYCAGNPIVYIDPDGRGWIKNDDDGTVTWSKSAVSQETTPEGSTYIGLTVYGTDENGSFVYGAQDGKTYDSAPLPEVTVTAEVPKHIKNMQAAAKLGIYKGQQAFLQHPITQAVFNVASFLFVPEIWATRALSSTCRMVPKTSLSQLKPLGLGATGRSSAVNLAEQLAMEEVLSNPGLGFAIKRIVIKDKRWLGWNKMQYIHTSLQGKDINIHYVAKWENGVIKAIDDFKFKYK